LNTTSRTITGIILFLCLTAPFVGLYVWLEVQKDINRKAVFLSVLKTLPDKELSHFHFSKPDAALLLKWKEDNEFEYQNTMYDVISLETNIDSVHIVCWCDIKETCLNNTIKQIVKGMVNQNPLNNKTGKTIFRFLQTLFVEKNDHLNLPACQNTGLYLSMYLNNYKGRYLQINPPPPEKVLQVAFL